MHRIVDCKVLPHYRIALAFEDGTIGTIDLSYLVGKGLFVYWHDNKNFEQVRIGTSGELVWNDQIDLCPDALFLKATGKKVEEVFPSLRSEPAHA